MSNNHFFAGAVVSVSEFERALEARRQAKGHAMQLSDDAVRSRIAFLKADNARMRALSEQQTKAANDRIRHQVELHAKAAAEQLMQGLLNRR
jgi:hypothetical protein